MAFSAFLDTCVLVPSVQRDLLLETASAGAFRPFLSQKLVGVFRMSTTR